MHEHDRIYADASDLLRLFIDNPLRLEPELFKKFIEIMKEHVK